MACIHFGSPAGRARSKQARKPRMDCAFVCTRLRIRQRRGGGEISGRQRSGRAALRRRRICFEPPRRSFTRKANLLPMCSVHTAAKRGPRQSAALNLAHHHHHLPIHRHPPATVPLQDHRLFAHTSHRSSAIASMLPPTSHGTWRDACLRNRRMAGGVKPGQRSGCVCTGAATSPIKASFAPWRHNQSRQKLVVSGILNSLARMGFRAFSS